MLNKYTIDCKMRGIRFEYDVKVCNLVQLEDIDLVAILGNLLDNAVTAAEKSKEKTISISTVRRNSYSVIILTNSCDTPPRCSGNRLISTKSDPGSHGFGIRSVEKAIRKYQGDYEWEYNTEKQLFTITVMLMEQPRTTAYGSCFLPFRKSCFHKIPPNFGIFLRLKSRESGVIFQWKVFK